MFYNKKSPLRQVDIMVQRDISFVMHRSVELWRTWYTEPLPNIGMQLSFYIFIRADAYVRVREFAEVVYDLVWMQDVT